MFVFVAFAAAFIPQHLHHSTPHHSSKLPDFDQEAARQHEVINDFVTQRALQTLIFYQAQNRDEVTAGWLSRFEDHDGIERFHGTQGLRLPWDEYLTSLCQAEDEQIVVELKRRGGHKKNPYLKDRYFNYTVSIEPRNLANRLFDLRIALAKEWRSDLLGIAGVLAELTRSRTAVVVNGTDDLAGLTMPWLEAYDPIGSGDATAFRGGNFDLLLRLSTHEAVKRTLRQLEQVKTPYAKLNHAFLKDFLKKRAKVLVRDGPYGVASSFLMSLADMPAYIHDYDPREKPVFLDPVAMADLVMKEQLNIVELWRSLLDHIPEDNHRVTRDVRKQSFALLRRDFLPDE